MSWFWIAITAAFLWAIMASLNSLIVRSYEKSPLVILWYSSLWTLLFVHVGVWIVPTQTSWIVPFIIVGLIGYCGDLLYYWIVDHVDVSLVNLTWATLAIHLSIVGLIVFGDTWTVQESFGACCVLGGIVLLSWRYDDLTWNHVLWMVCVLPFFFVPMWTVNKMALDDGVSPLTAMFWTAFINASISFVIPLLIPSLRKKLLNTTQLQSLDGFLILGGVIVFWVMSRAGTLVAYDLGPLSLVAIVGNVQPFIVIAIGWFLWRFLPAYAPREQVTRKSVRMKLMSFGIVFVGLAMIAYV